MKYRTPRLVTAMVLLVTVAASVLSYPSLPNEMATHWNAAGQVDGSMTKLYGAFLMPAIMLVVAIGMYVVPRIDPRRENIEAFRGTYEWFIAGVLAFVGYVHGLVLVWNLGVQLAIGRALVLPFAALIYGVGLLLERARPNWFIGIRTPWTLSDVEVWDRTHQRGARAFKLAGVLTLGGLVFPEYYLVFVLVPVLGSAAYAVGYSLLAYRRKRGSSS